MERPVRDSQAELKVILREAATLRSGGAMPRPDDHLDVQPPPPVPELRVIEGRTAFDSAPRRGVKFDKQGLEWAAGEGKPRPFIRLTPPLVIAALLGTLVAFLWLRLFVGLSASAAPPIDPAYAEASTRWAMVLTSQRIDDFRRKYHRTPADIQEVGHLASGLIAYERIAEDRYRLTAPSPNGPLVLDSMRPRRDFLGNSLETLRRAVGVRP